MTSEDNRDKKFVERLSSDPGLVVTAFGLIGDEYQGTDRFLLARRILDQELRAGPAGVPDPVYREAAARLARRGHRDEAGALRMVADTGTVLAAAGAEWAGRYRGRPATAAERKSERLIEAGQVRPDRPGGATGADGALYTPAVMTRDEAPAVIMAASTGTREVVTGFRNRAAQQDWIADRLRTGPREDADPGMKLLLWSALGDPGCRAAREERVLARVLLGASPYGEPASRDLHRTFTSSIRAEIYLAWCDVRVPGPARPSVATVREALERRMLRAPGWAADYVGWPFGQRALAYFDRIAATPVSARQGLAACRALRQEDRRALRAEEPAGRPRRSAGIPSPGPGLLMRPAAAEPSPGPSPRL